MTSVALTSSTYDITNLKPSTLKVLECIVSCSIPLNPSEILSRVKCSRRSVQYALKELTARGIIEKRPHFDDMRQSMYIIKAEIVKSKSYELIEIRLI